jgi:hypothetical protein
MLEVKERAHSAADEDCVGKALRSMRGMMLHSGGEEPSGRDLIEACLRLCVRVDRASAGVGHSNLVSLAGYRVARIRNSMPDVVHDLEEREESAKQRMIDMTAGDIPEDVPVTRHEISAAESIERVFRAVLVGENPNRDWRILFMLARKRSNDADGHQCEQEGSVRYVARKFGISPALVRKRRDVQMRLLVTALDHLLPQPTFTTGVVWDDRKAA